MSRRGRLARDVTGACQTLFKEALGWHAGAEGQDSVQHGQRARRFSTSDICRLFALTKPSTNEECLKFSKV